jgi:hypothetical protein
MSLRVDTACLPKPGTLRRIEAGGYLTRYNHLIERKDGWWYIYDNQGRVYDKAKQVNDLRRKYA